MTLAFIVGAWTVPLVVLLAIVLLDRSDADTDRRCALVDAELDQELLAQDQLRVQRTVQAEPIPVVRHTPGGWRI